MRQTGTASRSISLRASHHRPFLVGARSSVA
jgi:hypothetical protein